MYSFECPECGKVVECLDKNAQLTCNDATHFLRAKKMELMRPPEPAGHGAS